MSTNQLPFLSAADVRRVLPMKAAVEAMNSALRRIALLVPLVTASLAAAVSPDTTLQVAVAQPLVLVGDVNRNVENMESLVVEAARRGAKLVVFSECALTGYDLKGAGAKTAISTNSVELARVATLARKHGTTIVAGFYEKLGDTLHNSAAVLHPDGRRVIQRKHLIARPEGASCPVVPAGRDRTFFEVEGLRLALLICSDAGIPGIFEELAAAGCDAVIIITAGAGSERFGWHQAQLASASVRRKFARQASAALSPDAIRQCLELNLAQIACNQSGWDASTGYFQPGGSSIVDRTGEVAAVIPPRFVFEHLRPDLAVGQVSRATAPSTR
jgi:predicted amidohydrolase